MTEEKFGKNHHHSKTYREKIEWINNHTAGNHEANNNAASARGEVKAAQATDLATAKQTMNEMDPQLLQLVKDVAHNSDAAQQYAAMNMFDEANAIYENIFAHPVLPTLIGTPVGDSLKLKEMMLNMQTNYAICLFKAGKAEPASTLIEELIPKIETMEPAVPIQGIEILRNMLQQIYTGTGKHDLTLRSMTNNWKYYCSRFGEISEEAITMLNNRAMMHMGLQDYKSGADDMTEVTRMMCELQGADHPDTIGSIAQTAALFKSVGVAWSYPPA